MTVKISFQYRFSSVSTVHWLWHMTMTVIYLDRPNFYGDRNELNVHGKGWSRWCTVTATAKSRFRFKTKDLLQIGFGKGSRRRMLRRRNAKNFKIILNISRPHHHTEYFSQSFSFSFITTCTAWNIFTLYPKKLSPICTIVALYSLLHKLFFLYTNRTYVLGI